MSEAPTKPIRVLVANRPRLIRELLMATISDQPDIEIIGEIKDESEIAKEVDRVKPDFLIVALEGTDRIQDLYQGILLGYPRIKLIAIAPAKNNSILYWTSPAIQSRAIESSEDGLLRALRGANEQISGVSSNV